MPSSFGTPSGEYLNAALVKSKGTSCRFSKNKSAIALAAPI